MLLAKHTQLRVLCCAQDEVVRYRVQMRSQNLFNKSHSVSHNIITGEARHNPVPMPPAPAPPR
jgi:hypothetical protein